jgi:hypothetical protein
MNLKISFLSISNFFFEKKNTISNKEVAIPNRKKARDRGEISLTVNFAATGVNAAVRVRKITINIFFIIEDE